MEIKRDKKSGRGQKNSGQREKKHFLFKRRLFRYGDNKVIVAAVEYYGNS